MPVKHYHNRNVYLILSLCLLLTACTENVPVDRVAEPAIHLEVDREGTFSAYLKVSLANHNDPWTFVLSRDDSVVNTTTAHLSQLTVTDGGLNPGETYRYRAYFLQDGEKADSSEEVSATTLDTTNHNFNWYRDPPAGWDLSSQFMDIKIINENDAWAVGVIFSDEYDSTTGFDYSRFNASHWDGNNWTLKKIILLRTLFPSQGALRYDSLGGTIRNVYANNGDVLFLSSGAKHAYLINDEWHYFEEKYWSNQYGVMCMWGTSFNNIYLAGSSGKLVHDDGESYEFYQISSREIPFRDIWGLDDNHIWVVGYDRGKGNSQIMNYNGSTWYEAYYLDRSTWDIPDNPPDTLYGPVRTVWAYGDTVYFGYKYGIWKESITTGQGIRVSFEDMGTDSFWPIQIRGTGYNDIFIVGTQGRTMHYNGVNWSMCLDRVPGFIITSIDFFNDFIVIAGEDERGRALTIRGYR